MRAGLLRERINLQAPVATNGDDWGPGSNWTTEATMWAQVTPVSGTEKQSGDAIQTTVTHQIRMRYLSDVTSKWRAIYRSRVLDFVSVIDVDGMGRELRIEAREHQANG